MPVLSEEIGHHLETLVREGDSPGDEGELFSRLFMGETLGRGEVESLRRENDQGVVDVNGRGVEVEFETQDGGITIIGGDGDDDAAGVAIIINDEGDSQSGFSFGDLFDSSSNDNEEFDFEVLPDGRGFVRARNRGFDHDIINATGSRQTGIQPYFNGRVIEETDGSWQFELVHISGTHNNYELVATKTPYDELVRTSGIDWQLLDRAWLELTEQGNTEAAAQLLLGILPPLELFSEATQNELKSAQTAPPIDGPFANGGPIPGEEVDLGNGQKAVRVKSMDIDIIDASNAGPYINGRVIGPEDGFSNFRLEKIEGTHNNYTLLPDITPYDHLVQSSGIPWQDIDRAHLDLKAKGFVGFADLLQTHTFDIPPDGTSPWEAFEFELEDILFRVVGVAPFAFGEVQRILAPEEVSVDFSDENFRKWTGGLSIEDSQQRFFQQTGNEITRETIETLFTDPLADREILIDNPEIHTVYRDILNSNTPQQFSDLTSVEWKELTVGESLFHGSLFRGNRKFVSREGGYREVVFGPDETNQVDHNVLRGTFNFFDPELFPNAHILADVDPYVIYGN